MGATNCAPVVFYEATPTRFREFKFVREYNGIVSKKNKDYVSLTPTFGEMKTYLRLELRRLTDLMQQFTNRYRRELFLTKLGEVERVQDMGEIESKRYLANKIAIDFLQILKDICLSENLDFNSIRTTTALQLTEDECIRNFTSYVERLFYIDINLTDTLLLIYSTLVSYLNYHDLVHEDIEKMCIITETEEGSFYNGKLLYKL